MTIAMKTTLELLQTFKEFDGVYKEDEVNQIALRQEEAIPLLIDLLKNAIKNNLDYLDMESYLFDHIYAFELLGAFQATAAHQTIVELFSLPDDIPELMFGDALTEDLSMILLRTYDGDITKINGLIENESAYVFSRIAAVDSLSYLMIQEDISRDELIKYYKSLFITLRDSDDNSLVLAAVISSLCNIYPEELLDEITSAFEDKRVDCSCISFNYVQMTLKESKENIESLFEENLKARHMIYDDIHTLKNWPCFDKAETINDHNSRIEEELSYLTDRVPTQTLIKTTSKTKETKSKKKQAKKSKKANRKKKK
jgi:hypothetical protein